VLTISTHTIRKELHVGDFEFVVWSEKNRSRLDIAMCDIVLFQVFQTAHDLLYHVEDVLIISKELQ